MHDLDPLEVIAWQSDSARDSPLLIDVRADWEREICAIAGSQSLPMQELAQRIGELPPARDLVIVCHSGRRSAMATNWLRSQGYRAHNLRGGIDLWAQTVDKSMRRY